MVVKGEATWLLLPLDQQHLRREELQYEGEMT